MPVVPTLITREEIESAPKLLIEVIESPTLPKGQRYAINAGGAMNSRRSTQDGCVYMGTAEYNEEAGKCLNDIIVPAEEAGMGTVHLLIQYKSERKGYFIKDCGQGTGTFVKIERPLALRHGFIISYGDSHMYVSFDSKDKLQLKYLDGPKSDQMLYGL